jgi:hypothetical protein
MTQPIRHVANNLSCLFQVSGCFILQWKTFDQLECYQR